MGLMKVAMIGGDPTLVQFIQKSLITYGELLHFQEVSDSKISSCSIALLCHDLPQHDGVEVLLYLKHYHPSVVPIMLGVTASQQDIVKSFKIGAKDFLFSPFDKKLLLECLSRFTSPKSRSSRWWAKLFPINEIQQTTPTFGIVDPSFMKAFDDAAVSSSAAVMKIRMLGVFSVSFNGKTLSTLPSKKALSVLAYIFYKYPRVVHRDVLIDEFWSDNCASSARNCLNVTLHAIRKCLNKISNDKNVLIYKNECYGINPEIKVDRDFDLFESFWEEARNLDQEEKKEAALHVYESAFSFYLGHFMEELLYEEWAENARDHFKEAWLVILDLLSAHLFEQKAYQRCISLCQKMLDEDLCLEGVHRRLMLCFLKSGMKNMAIRQFKKCKEGLKNDLNISPGGTTLALYQKILEH